MKGQRCSYCTGNLLQMDGELKCLACGRTPPRHTWQPPPIVTVARHAPPYDPAPSGIPDRYDRPGCPLWSDCATCLYDPCVWERPQAAIDTLLAALREEGVTVAVPPRAWRPERERRKRSLVQRVPFPNLAR